MKLSRIAVPVVLLLGAGAAVYAWAPWEKPKVVAPKVETAKVEKGTIAARVTATGTLAPRNAVQVGALVSGRLAELHADWNDAVKAGQVIARLEPQPFEAVVAQTRATLAVATANQAQAEVESREAQRAYARVKELKGRELVSSADLDAAQTKAASARAQIAARKAQVAQATAGLSQAELNLGYTVITSPVDGVVLQRSIDVGQTVAASFQAPTLFTIAEDLRRMQIDTSVAEADVGRISQGMPATFSVDAYPGRSFTGKVRQVRNAPKAVQGVVTYNAVIDVDNDDLVLKPGMTATVAFVTREIIDVVRIPNSALRFRPAPDVIRKLRGEAPAERPSAGLLGGMGGPPGAGRSSPGDADGKRTVWRMVAGKAQSVRVATGLTDGSWTEQKEGELAPGDELVTDVAAGQRP